MIVLFPDQTHLRGAFCMFLEVDSISINIGFTVLYKYTSCVVSLSTDITFK